MVFDIIGKSANKIVDFGETCCFFHVVLKYCGLQVVSDCLVKAQRCDKVLEFCRQGDFYPVPWLSTVFPVQ